MNAEQVAKELAEEIRSNSALRHRLGMEEGSESGLVGDDTDHQNEVALHTANGETFFLVVEEG